MAARAALDGRGFDAARSRKAMRRRARRIVRAAPGADHSPG